MSYEQALDFGLKFLGVVGFVIAAISDHALKPFKGSLFGRSEIDQVPVENRASYTRNVRRKRIGFVMLVVAFLASLLLAAQQTEGFLPWS